MRNARPRSFSAKSPLLPERIEAKDLRMVREASRRSPAAMGGTMPDLEDIRRRRVDDL